MAKKKQKKIQKSSPKALYVILGIILIVVVLGLVKKAHYQKNDVAMYAPRSFDFSNATIMLDDQSITFMDGSFSVSDHETGEHSAVIGNRSLSQKGERAAAILVDSPSGSGTFYYVVGSMKMDGKDVYSKPVLLGDRIKIQSVKVDDPMAEDNGEITVEYLDRTSDEPMSADPTAKVTVKYAFQDDGNLIEVLN